MTNESANEEVTYQVIFDGHIVASSDHSIMVEGYRYFPRESVNMDLLTRSWMKSLCYWKGMASYYTIDTGLAVDRHSAWTYAHPSPLARRIKGHIAFWPGAVTIETV